MTTEQPIEKLVHKQLSYVGYSSTIGDSRLLDSIKNNIAYLKQYFGFGD